MGVCSVFYVAFRRAVCSIIQVSGATLIIYAELYL